MLPVVALKKNAYQENGKAFRNAFGNVFAKDLKAKLLKQGKLDGITVE